MHACYRTIIAILLMLALQLVALSSGAFAQRPLAVPGARSTIASGINDAGTIIVGAYIDTSGRDHGFLWHGSGITPLDVPGAVDTEAFGINAAGTSVVGLYEDTSGTTHGFLWQGAASPPSTSRARGAPEPSGSMRPAPSSWADTRTPAARTTALCGRGQLHRPRRPGRAGYPSLGDQCGWHHRRGHVHGQQRHGARLCVAGGSFTALFDFPGARAPEPWGSMRLAPSSWAGTGTPAARTTDFVAGGSFTPFDFPGARSTQALGINAAGTIIVGMYADSSTTHGFVIP